MLRVLAFVLLTVTPVFSQEKNRVVEWSNPPLSPRNTMSTILRKVVSQIDVLEINGITIGDKSIEMGAHFAADDDWLGKLTFRIKSVSSLKISNVQMHMLLPEIMPGGPLVTFCYGCGLTQGQSIEPGQEVEMKVALYNWLTGQINSKTTLSQITKAQIHVITVRMEDGREFVSGCVKTTDQKNACPQSQPDKP